MSCNVVDRKVYFFVSLLVVVLEAQAIHRDKCCVKFYCWNFILSILDRLKVPRSSDLSRKCEVKGNPPVGIIAE